MNKEIIRLDQNKLKTVLESESFLQGFFETYGRAIEEYEENPARLSELFRQLIAETPTLVGIFERIAKYGVKAYGYPKTI